MVCFRYIIVHTLHKGDNKDEDNDDDNNNNNNNNCIYVGYLQHRFRNNVKNDQTLPGADIDSDHNLLVAKIHTWLKNIIRFQKSTYKMGFGEAVCSKTNSAGCCRRETWCS
jgi:hypothetical protein